MSIFSKFIKNLRDLPEKKRYIEFFSAILSLPVLITVILLNVNNLNNLKKNSETTPDPTPTNAPISANDNDQNSLSISEIQSMISSTIQNSTSPPASSTGTFTPAPQNCKNEIGPVRIISPREGEIVARDPVLIDITNDPEYCSLIWSYSLDGQPWAEFTNKAIYLYNLTPGDKNLEVKIRNPSNDNEIILKKNFTYQGTGATSTPIPTADPT